MTDVQTRPDTDLTGTGEQPAGNAAATSRRVVLVGAGALGAGCLLAACGTDSSTSSSTTGANGGDFSNDPAPAGSSTAGPKGGGDSSGGGATLVAVADVPEGGGVIKGDYVITQPEAGTYKAFSKICTHQGCPVNKVENGQIKCPCHASTFSIEDGSPTGGPATKALAETKVKVDGDNVVSA